MGQRHYLFTLFGERASEGVQFLSEENLNPLIRYATWQQEKCPDTQRLHLQGYIEFKKPQRLPAVKRLLGASSVHLERRNGSRDEARAYCRKDETRVDGPWEVGHWIGEQGSRSDLRAVHSAIQEGHTDIQISDDFFPEFAKYYRGIAAYRLLHTSRRNHKMEVLVLWGPTGTGKSMGAWEYAPDAHILSPDSASSGVGWWCGYSNHEAVIMDDFYGGMRYSFMLQLLDRYPLRVMTKGGSTEFVAKKIIITSNKHPADWYDFDKFGPQAWPAFNRRLTRIVHCLTDTTWHVQK